MRVKLVIYYTWGGGLCGCERIRIKTIDLEKVNYKFYVNENVTRILEIAVTNHTLFFSQKVSHRKHFRRSSTQATDVFAQAERSEAVFFYCKRTKITTLIDQ